MIDRKFKFVAVSQESGETHTEQRAFVMLAKDLCVPEALRAYLAECRRRGVGQVHIREVTKMLDRILDFQQEYPELCKIPDTIEPQ